MCAGAMVMSTSGCDEEKDVILKGTILQGAIVGQTEDGHCLVLREVSVVKHECINDKNPYHYHYQDVVSGEYLTNSENCYTILLEGSVAYEEAHPRYVHFTSIESISDYLTKEELQNAENLSEDDINEIVTRIMTNNEDKAKVK